MKALLFFSLLSITSFFYTQSNSEFDKLPSGIYFKDGNQITALDPTIVSFSKRGNIVLHAYGLKIKSIGELTGKEANYAVKSKDKFYFKFKPEEKELNSSNSNATNKVGEENYMNILLSSTNSKAISPNEFKLIKFKLKNGKRTYYAGRYNDAMGYIINYSLSPKEVVDFKYKKIDDNIFEIYFPNGLVEGEYSFVYLSSTQSNLPLKSSITKVFDFSVR